MTVTELLALLGRAIVGIVLQIALIVALAWIVIRVLRALGHRIEDRLQRTEVDLGRRARLRTLLATALHTTQVIIVLLAALMVLYSLGINITPILAGFGVAGLAVSLGAQALIRDFIGGILILIENQYRVGDVIQVGTTSGVVEQIMLRTTHVRDDQGRLWVIPNGEVRIVSNCTRDWARAVVDLSVPVAADMERALAALETAMQRAAADEAIRPDLLETPLLRGWNNLTESAVQVQVAARTVAGKQWDVARVLRQYAIAGLHEAGILGARTADSR